MQGSKLLRLNKVVRFEGRQGLAGDAGGICQTLTEVVEVALAVGAAAVARADAGHGLGDEGPAAARQRETAAASGRIWIKRDGGYACTTDNSPSALRLHVTVHADGRRLAEGCDGVTEKMLHKINARSQGRTRQTGSQGCC